MEKNKKKKNAVLEDNVVKRDGSESGKKLPKDPASEEALESDRNQTIRDTINSFVKCMPKDKKEPLMEAVYAICIGELTVSEAAKKYRVDKLRKTVMKTLRDRLGY
ncbi:hypothetical protein PENTCL1PPCAC_14980, partial [Pristionchus entomophagus]